MGSEQKANWFRVWGKGVGCGVWVWSVERWQEK